jgi:hypothetical protein
MHWTIMLIADIWLIYPLGHVYAEPKLEEPTEQAQAEDFTNQDLDLGKAPMHLTNAFVFYFEALLYVLLLLCIKS